jgi:hypothetical protein
MLTSFAHHAFASALDRGMPKQASISPAISALQRVCESFKELFFRDHCEVFGKKCENRVIHVVRPFHKGGRYQRRPVGLEPKWERFHCRMFREVIAGLFGFLPSRFLKITFNDESCGVAHAVL